MPEVQRSGQALTPPPENLEQRAIEEIEVQLLLEGVFRQTGYDFRSYAPASLKRRILNSVAEEKVATISRLQEKVLRDPEAIKRLLLRLTVQVTAMFRDPEFYLSFRRLVVPILKTYPSLNFWVAGCSKGEEVYSLSLLLLEEGLLKRSAIYATDLHEEILDQARSGSFPLSVMQEYTRNYQRAGGQKAFSEYYKVLRDTAQFNSSVRSQITFAQHNLATDSSFNEFHVILCRNVLIYFNQNLQNHVHRLFYQSLIPLGILGLGQRETLQFSSCATGYSELDPRNKLYRKSY